MLAADSRAVAGAFAPLGHRAFTVLWIATVVSNVGGWMTDTASGWLMTSLAPSPVMVALVQAATTAPMFLLALPAGALADVLDRRKLMIAIQLCLAGITLCLALLTTFDGMTAERLLVLTFVAGVGAALLAPVWQSIVPELVPAALLRPAVALNSLGFNIGRAVGPVVGGILIVTLGVSAPYFADVICYVLIVGALIWWKREATRPDRPESFGGALRAGLRYARYSPSLHRILLRAAAFFISASCYWALLPLLVRQDLHGGASAYGVMLGAIGLGAIAGALALPKVRQSFDGNWIVLGGTIATAAVLGSLAMASSVLAAALLLFVAGAAWISVLTTLNATAQSVLPNWVRGRGVAIYLTIFYGGMTLGSLLWGRVAQATSIDTALWSAAALAAITGLLAARFRLPESDEVLTPSLHWPEPAIASKFDADAGPVMVTIEYAVAMDRHLQFLEAIRPLGDVRRRDGAYEWGVMFDAEAPRRVTEWFLVASWQEHLRQHARVSFADKALEDRVRALADGKQPVIVRHQIDLVNSQAGIPILPAGHTE